MANSHLPITSHIAACKLLLSLHLLLVASRLSDAQSSSDETSDDGNNLDKTPSKFHPIRPLLIAVIIGTVVIMLVYTFYIRRWRNERLAALDLSATLFPSSRQRGLDTAVLDSFPTMLYSDVKGHKIGKGELECAVCLNEFDDDDSLRLLPKCSHVFHEDCIDAWLAKHVTCPVCRADLDGPGHGPQEVAAEQVEVAVEVAEEERRREMKELARIASRTRRGSVSRQKRLLRWNTTGHIGEDLERYTLRLPENVRHDIVVARRLQRERSVPARSTHADQDGIGAAGKIWRRGGEAGGRPSFRRVLSAQWSSFLQRPQQ